MSSAQQKSSSNVKKYFVNLNYTSTNEDTLLELALMNNEEDHVVSISGSGSRVLPLIGKTKKILSCVDYSPYQLKLTELRIETLRKFDYEKFLLFWGYPLSTSTSFRELTSKERRNMFQRLDLLPDTKDFFEEVFQHNKWKSILYIGNWEKTMKKMGFFMQIISGGEPQKEKLESLRWKMAVFFLTQKQFFNSLLYKGKFPALNLSTSYYSYHKKIFDELLDKWTVDENYFLQTVFKGKILTNKCLPAEANFECFSKAKSNVDNIQIRYKEGNLFDCIHEMKESINFVSLSDIPSYFDKETGQLFLQKLKSKLSPNAKVVARYYCHKPENIDTNGFNSITHLHKENIKNERTQIYDFDIWTRNP